MAKDRAPSYTPAPEPPTDPALRRRYDEVMAVLTKQQTVAGAARLLGLSRNHFQTILHRALEAVIESITPKPAGRPSRPQREAALEAENARLKTELAMLEERVATMDRLLDLVGGIASGRESLTRRRGKTSTKKDEDPEPAIRTMEKTVAEVDAPAPLRARALGVSVATMRRRRRSCPQPPREIPTTHPDRAAAVRELVRVTHGLAGAASLAKSTGVSRREAARIKQTELTEIERERKARAATVSVTAPGVIRGFDAMHMICSDGPRYWLIAADAAVPFRTSIATVASYDHEHVIAALAADFEEHGPPLVLRLDRAACQRTPEVRRLLDRFGVLPLHGPPRHPGYYGQLERQNREHRAWLRPLDRPSSAHLPELAAEMRTVLNTRWARPTLDWCTAEQAWQMRSTIRVDRRKLSCDVEHRAERIASTTDLDPVAARRRATESALVDLGLLTIKLGGQC